MGDVSHNNTLIENGTITFDISTNSTYTLISNSFSKPGLAIGTTPLQPSKVIVTRGTLMSYIKIATKSGTNGELNLTSTGKTEGELFIGERGHGIMTIDGDASHVGNTLVGMIAGSEGELTISGGGASLTGGTTIGSQGTATVNVIDGGKILGVLGRSVASSSNSNSVLNVTGSGSKVEFRNITIGSYGIGELNLTDGGSLAGSSLGVSEFVQFGGTKKGSGTGLISGQNSSLSTGGLLTVGVHGTGNLVVENGAMMESQEGNIGLTSTATGTVNIDDGVWTISDSLNVGGSSMAAGLSGTLSVQNNGLVDVNGDTRIWPRGVMQLVGASANTNRLELFGLLTIDGSSVFTSNTDIMIHPNAKISSIGTINGNVISASELAIENPGNQAPHNGTTINGNFSQSFTGTLTLPIFGATQDDVAKLIVNGDIESDGQIIVKFENGFVPEIGDEYDIFDSSVAEVNKFKLDIVVTESGLGVRYKDRAAGIIEITTAPILIPTTPNEFLIIFVLVILLSMRVAFRGR